MRCGDDRGIDRGGIEQGPIIGKARHTRPTDGMQRNRIRIAACGELGIGNAAQRGGELAPLLAAADQSEAQRRSQHYQAVQPPSTTSTCPVTKSDAAAARNTTAPRRSSPLPTRCMGVRLARLDHVLSSRSGRLLAVRIMPGAMALTWMPWAAHSTARARVKLMTAPLLALYAAAWWVIGVAWT